ncbi:hypothetical protein HDU81_010931 [Chytriomyces hyalinus]|nr:hypothetical protein HDU81_010931 [Chytriomyces hyalinus]
MTSNAPSEDIPYSKPPPKLRPSKSLSPHSIRSSLPDLSRIIPLQASSPWFKFKLFVLQSKVLESGVGVVLGKAFQEFVRSFLNDLLAPPILYFVSDKAPFRFIVIKQGRTKQKRYRTVEEAAFDGALTINYGRFGHSCVNFFVVGLSVYYFLNVMKTFFQSQLEHSRKCPFCISDIPVEATRCSQCTSHVDPVTPKDRTSASWKDARKAFMDPQQTSKE